MALMTSSDRPPGALPDTVYHAATYGTGICPRCGIRTRTAPPNHTVTGVMRWVNCSIWILNFDGELYGPFPSSEEAMAAGDHLGNSAPDNELGMHAWHAKQMIDVSIPEIRTVRSL
jgi:hypothetical protein